MGKRRAVPFHPGWSGRGLISNQEIVDAIVYIHSFAVEPQTAANGSDDEENCS